MATVIDSKKSTGGSPYHYYSLAFSYGTRTATSIVINYSITAWLASSSSHVATGPLEADIAIGASSYTVKTVTLRANNTSWSGTTHHTKQGSFTLSGLSNTTTSLNTRLRVRNEGGSSGDLGWTDGKDYTIPQNDSYTITYNANGGSNAPSKQTKWKGVSISLSSSTPTRAGYSFYRWNTKSDGSGTNYASGATYSTNASATLYARWTAHNYSVAFNANGGSGSMDNESFTYGAAKALTNNTFTRTGYAFVGWATSAGGGVVYTDGQSVKNLTTTSGGVVNLYAVWEITYTPPAFNTAVTVPQRWSSDGVTPAQLDEDGQNAYIPVAWTNGNDGTNATYVNAIKIDYQVNGASTWTNLLAKTSITQGATSYSVTTSGNAFIRENSYNILITLYDNNYPDGVTYNTFLSKSTYIWRVPEGSAYFEFGVPVKVNSGVSSLVNTGSSGATFRTTTETESVSIRGGNKTDSYATVNINHTLSGYFPIALIEYAFSGSHATWLNVYINRLTNVSSGSCTAQIGVRDLTDGTTYVTPTISTTVLWAKEA